MSDSSFLGWHREQVQSFNQQRGSFIQAAEVLEKVLHEIRRRTDPVAIVQSRHKSLASFSEKAIRKKHKYQVPVKQLTDLVGGRIITYTQASADTVCRFIESLDKKSLRIDWDNTINTADRLKPEEFGYKAMHYVVHLNPPSLLEVPIGSWLEPIKMEIQVSTMLQHVWAAIGHDRIYKTQMVVGDNLKRRLSAISALIEMAQTEFDSGIVALDRYIQFLPHKDAKTSQEDRMIWESVVDVEPDDIPSRRKLGENLESVGDWPNAYEQYLACASDGSPRTFTKLGRAAARLGRIEEALAHYERGLEVDPHDSSVRCDLAELLEENQRHDMALSHYKQALDAAPHEPRVLVRYVTALVRSEGRLSCAQALGGALETAAQECQHRADLGVDLPQAFFQAARCHLFRKDLYASLDAYCKAALRCKAIDQIDAERADIQTLLEILSNAGHDRKTLLPYQCAARLLSLMAVAMEWRLRRASAVMHDQQSSAAVVGDSAAEARLCEQLSRLATPRGKQPSFDRRPVVIVAGGCDLGVDERLQVYRAAIKGAFSTFEGTIICGGTTAGVSGLVAQATRPYREKIHCVGYLPVRLPEGDVRDDANYQIIELVDDEQDYTPLGPIQTWADLLLADVAPEDVRLLGINGGDLSGFEFRLASVMGATVGLIEDSGRAVSTLLTDRDWSQQDRIAPLLNEDATIAPFIAARCPALQAIADPGARARKIEEIARGQHEVYVADHLTARDYIHESMFPWDKGLNDRYKESNRSQVAYADRILASEGFAIVASNDPRPAVDLEDPTYASEVNRMARLEHGRFNAERLSNGWRYGPERNLEARTSPYLIPWDKLPEETREWDRLPFRNLSAKLTTYGLKIVSNAESKQ